MKYFVHNLTIFWSICLFFLTGCSSEEVEISDEKINKKGEVEFSFRLSIPEPEMKASITRSQTLPETIISTADVLVFTQKAGATQYTYDYHAQGIIQSSTNPVSGFKARIKSTNLPVKLYILGNASPAEGKITTPAIGQTETEVKNNLSMAFSPAVNITNIPMWGEYNAPSGIVSTYRNQIEGVKMYRSLAKASVILDPALTVRFKINNLYLARSRSKVTLVPKNMDAAGMIVSPNVPAHSASDILAPLQFAPSSPIYLLEDDGWGTSTDIAHGANSNKHTCIIVAGTLDGGAEKFYRVDVQQDNVYGRIIRNHHYKITLSGIKKEGVATLQQALDLASPSMTYEVNAMDLSVGLTTINFDNIEQLSAAEKQIIIAPAAGIKDIKINPGINNTQLEIASYSGGVAGTFGQYVALPSIGGTVKIAVNTFGEKVLHFITGANTTPADISEQIILKSPSKALFLDIIKKSPNTIGISAVVEGSTDPQRAEFLSTGGTKIITITSSMPWQVEGIPYWINTQKISDTQLKISVVEAQAGRDREHVISIKNKIGQLINIEVYQQYQLEWSAGFLRGGDHIIDLLNWKDASSIPLFQFQINLTPKGTPSHFGKDLGDVHALFMPPIKLHPGYFDNYNADSFVYAGPRVSDLDMIGDSYSYAQAKTACPAGWRLPTYKEAKTLVNNMQWSGLTNYINQNGKKVYFPAYAYQWNYILMWLGDKLNSNIYIQLHLPMRTLADKTSKRSFFITTSASTKESFPVRCVR